MRSGLTCRAITLEEQAAVERLYRTYGRGDSAHAFPSLFLWKEDMQLSLCLAEEGYTVRSGWKDGWFFPCGSRACVVGLIEALLEAGCRRLCYLTEADVRLLEEEFPGRFSVRESPEDSEYLYDRREMIELPGRRFAKLRNLCRRLEREHSLSVEPLTERSLPTVREIAGQWERASARTEGISGARATALLLDHWTQLGAGGVLLILDGEPWAAAAGFPLGEGVFDCCFQKARVNLPGVTESVRAALAAQSPASTVRFNYEEDLDVEGLRLMKRRLRPCDMIRMYTGEVR